MGRMTQPEVVATLQRAWWVVGVAGALIGALGIQWATPSARLRAIERHNAWQDSVARSMKIELQEMSRTVDNRLIGIERDMRSFINGTCVKERDRMARLVYGCDR